MRPEPGIVIIKPEKQEDKLIFTTQNQTRLLKGTVIAVGKDVIEGNELKRLMEDYAQVGDTVYFLSYEGQYDCFYDNNEKYYTVKVDDLRVRI